MDNVQDSPITPQKPGFDILYQYEQEISVTDTLQYTGQIYFGDDFQGSSNMLYDTGSRLTVIPRVNADGTGWYDHTSESNVTIYSTSLIDYTVFGQTIQCELAYGALCGKNTDNEVSVSNDCAYTMVCLTTVTTIPGGYDGIVGMGKWSPADTEANYYMQLYIQQQLEPELYFDWNFDFDNQTSVISKIPLLSSESNGQIAGNTFSYSASEEWALQVTSWTWNDATFSPNEEDVSDIAVLASGHSYIGVPEPLYIDIWADFEIHNWTCITTQSSSSDNYCYIDSNCKNYIDLFPEFYIQFNQSSSATSISMFEVVIYPELYLVEDGDNACKSALRQVDDDQTTGFILGAPFFRNVSVALDYPDQAIVIYTKDVDSPLNPVYHYPDWDTSMTREIPLVNLPSGQYQGSIFVGTAPQGGDDIAAYSSSSKYTVIPSANSANVRDGWFDESASSTFVAGTGNVTAISIGVWGGICSISQDTMMLESDTEMVSNVDFCLLTNEPIQSDYNYTAVVGLGKPDSTIESLMDSLIGEMWTQFAYRPQVTYEFNFDGYMSMVRFGDYDGADDNRDLFMTATSSAVSTNWGLPVVSAVWDGVTYNDFDVSVAVLDSDYPYIAVPDAMWTAVYNSLIADGFVCFDSAFTQLTHCTASSSCAGRAYDLPAMTLTFAEGDSSVSTHDYTIDATFYLF